MRDMIFNNPWPLIQAFCENRHKPIEIPKNIKRFREFQTKAGLCDLLFVWHRRAVVVEMKRDFVDDSTISQCLRYIGAIEHEHGVFPDGIICAPSITANGKFALHAYEQEGGCRIQFMEFSFSYDIDIPEETLESRGENQPEGFLWNIVFPEFNDPPASNPIIEQAHEIIAAIEQTETQEEECQ